MTGMKGFAAARGAWLLIAVTVGVWGCQSGGPQLIDVTAGTKLFELLAHHAAGGDGPTPIGLASWSSHPADPSRADTIDRRIDFHGPQFLSGGPPYPDISAYAGVAFTTRLADGATFVVAIEDDQVVSNTSYAETRASSNPWFEHAVTLSADARRHILLFDDFRQPDHADARLRTQAVWSIHFIGDAATTGTDFPIDDLLLLCHGSCPAPTWNVPVTPAPGMDDESLPWVTGAGSAADATCATIAPLSLAPLSDVAADAVEKQVLRVRIPAAPTAAVTQWAWVLEDIATGEQQLNVTPIDTGWSTVAVPISAPGHYKISAHTHYPGTSVCGVQTEIDAH